MRQTFCADCTTCDCKPPLYDRIEQLEAALQLIAEYANVNQQFDVEKIARAALDNLCEDEGCPNAGTPHVCINRQENAAGWHIEPKRQENDDIFPGFRGNNEA